MPEKPVKTVKGITQYSAVGLEMGLSVVIGFGIGYYLDEYFHTEWQKYFWLGCGAIAGFRALYRAAKKFEAEDRAEDENAEKDRKK